MSWPWLHIWTSRGPEAKGTTSGRRYNSILPVEIWEEILLYLQDDFAAIMACKQTCRSLYPLAHYLGYSAMTISSMREFVCFPKAVTEHPRIATAVHTLSLYVSESEESFSWGQSRRSMSELFAAMVHMDCLEELSFIGPFVIPATFPEPLQRMLCKGRAKLPIKTLRLSFTKPSVPRPEYDTTLCLVLLACPRLETLLLCESGNMRMGRPPSYRPLWQRGVQWLQLPPAYATVEASTARALDNIRTLILDMADPEDGPDGEYLGHWLATATDSPFTRIAALLHTDAFEGLMPGCTQYLLRTAGPRLESLRVTLAYNRDGVLRTRESPRELLSSNVNLRSIFVHVTFPHLGRWAELAIGLPQVLSAIGPAHTSVKRVCVCFTCNDLPPLETDWPGYPIWQDELRFQLARLFEEHPRLVITLALRVSSQKAVTRRDRPRRYVQRLVRLLTAGLRTGAAHGRRLEVIWAEQQDIVGMDNHRLLAEPPWYVPLSPVNGP